MNKIIIDLDSFSGLATVDTEATPQEIEKLLNEQGFTVGIGEMEPAEKFPLRDYLHGEYCLEPYLAGQDLSWICASVEASLVDGGKHQTVKTPRSAAGPDLRYMLMGGKAKKGKIVKADLRIKKLPAERIAATFKASDTKSACAAVASQLHDFNEASWVRIWPEQESEGATLSLAFEAEIGIASKRMEIFEDALSADFKKIAAPKGYPDGSYESSAPPLPFAASNDDEGDKKELQLVFGLTWPQIGDFVTEVFKRSQGIYKCKIAIAKAMHQSGVLVLQAYSSDNTSWVAQETQELVDMIVRGDGAIYELRGFTDRQLHEKIMLQKSKLSQLLGNDK